LQWLCGAMSGVEQTKKRSYCGRSGGPLQPPHMPDKLNTLLERLKAHQRTLILAMAEHDGLPAGSALRQVAELENVIAAVEAVAAEEASRHRS
jgi:hypothetical protein